MWKRKRKTSSPGTSGTGRRRRTDRVVTKSNIMGLSPRALYERFSSMDHPRDKPPFLRTGLAPPRERSRINHPRDRSRQQDEGQSRDGQGKGLGLTQVGAKTDLETGVATEDLDIVVVENNDPNVYSVLYVHFDHERPSPQAALNLPHGKHSLL